MNSSPNPLQRAGVLYSNYAEGVILQSPGFGADEPWENEETKPMKTLEGFYKT